MHVLIIPSQPLLTARHPIAGIFQIHQADALQRGGFQVGVIAPGVITVRFLLRRYPYPRFERTNGYPVLRHYARSYFPLRWRQLESVVAQFRDLGETLYKSYVAAYGRPDVVHAHNIANAGFIAQAIHERHRVPYVITEHSSQYLVGHAPAERSARMAQCARAAGAMTAVSRALADAVADQLSLDEVAVLPNVVDPSMMASPLVARRNRERDITFLSVGALNSNKDHASLINAFARHFKGQPAAIRIGGTGPLRRDLGRLARRLGVRDQVEFLGYLDRQALLRELQAADCVVQPSLHETFGVVLIEALACGRPVIATRCGGPEDIVDESNGLLVEPGDTAALGAAMERMAITKGQYRPERLREDCDARFGEAAFIKNARRAYHNALR
ncbi:MAG: glycosyltransferase [Planctomycetes bacterium]|nr:glycosyltransferase [Planctomycetota bacterium]